MATIEEMKGILNSLNTSSTGFNVNAVIPGKEVVMKNLLKDSVPESQIDETVEKSKNSFFGSFVDFELNNLKSSLVSFMNTVPTLATSIASQIGSVAGNPVTINCAPAMITGMKGQLGTLSLQAAQILSSCIFLGIILNDEVLLAIGTLEIIKTALDAIPI